MKKFSAWSKLWMVGVIGLVLINLYFSYLESRIIPFEISVPLSQQGYERQFEIDSFHAAKYFLMIALDRPIDTDDVLARPWAQFEEQLRIDCDVELGLTLTDSKGRVVFSHIGSLQTWRLTDAIYTKNGLGTFYRYYFDAKIFESYRLDVQVLRSSKSAQKYNPTLLFHGIDDGYFALRRLIQNTFWIALIGIFAIVGLIARLVRNRAQER